MFTGHLMLKTFKFIEERCRLSRSWWFRLHFARLTLSLQFFHFEVKIRIGGMSGSFPPFVQLISSFGSESCR